MHLELKILLPDRFCHGLLGAICCARIQLTIAGGGMDRKRAELNDVLQKLTFVAKLTLQKDCPGLEWMNTNFEQLLIHVSAFENIAMYCACNPGKF